VDAFTGFLYFETGNFDPDRGTFVGDLIDAKTLSRLGRIGGTRDRLMPWMGHVFIVRVMRGGSRTARTDMFIGQYATSEHRAQR
jgi:hypothetical protein